MVQLSDGSHMRQRIADMMDSGALPTLALGVVNRAVVLTLSADHESAAAQLEFLIARLAEGDSVFVSDA